MYICILASMRQFGCNEAEVLALQNLEVVGEIRTPTDYLVQLLKTEAIMCILSGFLMFKRAGQAFIQNRIDTGAPLSFSSFLARCRGWLDGLIRERAVRLTYEPRDVAFFAAVLRSFKGFQLKDLELQRAIEKRRLGLLHQVEGSGHMVLEIPFEGSSFLGLLD